LPDTGTCGEEKEIYFFCEKKRFFLFSSLGLRDMERERWREGSGEKESEREGK
jgi:hypothetical protein